MQLYFKANDIVTLSWLPEEVVPSYITNDITNIRVDIQLFQQGILSRRSLLDWIPIDGAEMINLSNNGLQEFRIPAGLEMKICSEQSEVCPVAFKVSATRNTEVDITSPGVAPTRVILPTRQSPAVGIWSGVAYLQADTTDSTSLLLLCNKWAEDTQKNAIPTSSLESLPVCPPTQALASVDVRFRREQLESVATQMDTGYAVGATAFYHPEVTKATCYLEVVMDIR